MTTREALDAMGAEFDRMHVPAGELPDHDPLVPREPRAWLTALLVGLVCWLIVLAVFAL